MISWFHQSFLSNWVNLYHRYVAVSQYGKFEEGLMKAMRALLIVTVVITWIVWQAWSYGSLALRGLCCCGLCRRPRRRNYRNNAVMPSAAGGGGGGGDGSLLREALLRRQGRKRLGTSGAVSRAAAVRRGMFPAGLDTTTLHHVNSFALVKTHSI